MTQLSQIWFFLFKISAHTLLGANLSRHTICEQHAYFLHLKPDGIALQITHILPYASSPSGKINKTISFYSVHEKQSNKHAKPNARCRFSDDYVYSMQRRKKQTNFVAGEHVMMFTSLLQCVHFTQSSIEAMKQRRRKKQHTAIVWLVAASERRTKTAPLHMCECYRFSVMSSLRPSPNYWSCLWNCRATTLQSDDKKFINVFHLKWMIFYFKL